VTAVARPCVLDASALLALLNDEPGAAAVSERLDGASMSAVNWCEAYGKLRAAGVPPAALTAGMAETGITIVAFDADQACVAGELLPLVRRAGLSLADRACLSLAQRLGVPAVTADTAWRTVDVGVDVVCVR
jgi:ribonuclease VapC